MASNKLHLVNSYRYVAIGLIIAALAAVCGISSQMQSIALAQGATPTATPSLQPCGSYQCTDKSDFNNGADGWSAYSMQWMQSKTLGLWDTATGVVEVSNPYAGALSSYLSKDIFLQPGNYRVAFKAGGGLGLLPGAGNTIGIEFDGQNIGGDEISPIGYSDHLSAIASITDPKIVHISLSGRTPFYFDYIWIIQLSNSDPTPTQTPTPATAQPTSQYPTATTVPHTAIPIENQATPIATATPYCIQPPAPTTASQFLTTPTSAPESGFAILEQFNGAAFSGWSILGTYDDTHIAANDHTLYGLYEHYDISSGSAFISYNDLGGEVSTTSDIAHALVFSRSFSDTFYIDGWSQSYVLPSGESAFAEIWGLYPSDSMWHQLGKFQISSQQWYPFHATITFEGSISALAFVSSRSDIPGYGGVYFDDLYIYQYLSNAPYCDGTYQAGVTDTINQPFTMPPDNPNYQVDWPADRPCPADLTIPNNFWGPILAAITQFVDDVFKWSPIHQAGLMVENVRLLFVSPVGVIFVFLSILFDWTIPLIVLSFWLVITSFFNGVLLWKFLRRATVQ